MDVFKIRDDLIKDYEDFVRSFIHIKDERTDAKVDEEFRQGFLWPEPLIQLNPSFEKSKRIDDLVDEGMLHSECGKIFRIDKTESDLGRSLRLHRHQEDAIRIARGGNNYVLTTGTGSGKSLAYIVPIVDQILRFGSGKGIQAIIVYPMNALANSQLGELGKFLHLGYRDHERPVTFERYTGQESDDEKREIAANPPDILLTNYVMLELILTRPQERASLVQAAQDLRFLVLDELHTYRGRQGADVAMLMRRVRNSLNATNLQYVGTSATLAGPGTYQEQQREISRVATQLFGLPVKPENIIGETLARETPGINLESPEFIKKLKARLEDETIMFSEEYDEFINDPLSIWIESTFGLSTAEDGQRLVRSEPKSIKGENGAVRLLSEITQVSSEVCVRAIQDALLAGYKCLNPETGNPVFAFRIHQFISRGDNIYASLESESNRHITLQGQKYVPDNRDRILLPIVFCRECGQEYYCVSASKDDTDLMQCTPREMREFSSDDDTVSGFIFHNSAKPWPDDLEAQSERIPDDWLEEHRGNLRIRRDRKQWLPQNLKVSTSGLEANEGMECSFLRAPFRFCLHCGVSYDFRQRSDFPKLSTLMAGGRSTATTILSLSTILSIMEADLPNKARKLLSFTDNRQDASLQAGHFNDFIEVGLLRAALYKASHDAGPDGLSYEELTQKVFDALELPRELYAQVPDVKFAALADTQRALRDILGYRLYRDLRRGWRITAPNLEQCGLLEIQYESLNELSSDESTWSNLHPALSTAKPETRMDVAKTLLDFMRRELAIKVDYLNSEAQERIQQKSSQRLNPPWAIDENERMEFAKTLLPRSRRSKEYAGNVYLSARSGFGQYLRRKSTFDDYQDKLDLEETALISRQLLEALRVAGLVEVVLEPAKESDVPGYQLPAAAIRWVASDGTRGYHDPIRIPSKSVEGSRPNPFFIEFYRGMGLGLKGLEAREHTAQVPYEERIKREEDFREARLPILYCSPTMELGVDIKQLNAVNMRNVPPTPANYAQRSGRAGRSGQPAIVFSYCTTGSPHDQFFFKRPALMVAGAVNPPRLDLANEDLIRAHVQAIWLPEAGIDLGRSLKDLLDLEGNDPSLELVGSLVADIDNPAPKERAKKRAREVLKSIDPELQESGWYSDGWIDEVMNQIKRNFNDSCDRWRSLYKAALDQAKHQNSIIHDASRSEGDKKQAKWLRREAEAQLELLTESRNIAQSDFYSYRYFASEGFLPGYNFPRLPLSAYIPGRSKRQAKDEFLSRPRFLAISEFGPRAFVYHEGSRYIINKVILPPVGEDELLTSAAKLCPSCGYLHPVSQGASPDICELCETALEQPLRQLFRLRNVSTKRRDRISCDEEERLRQGFELRTAVRFAEYDGRPSYRNATVRLDDVETVLLTYGQAATLWRINLGWARRQDKKLYGFTLDTERGYWAKNEALEEDESQDPMSESKQRVIPFVEDRKNCLLLRPAQDLDESMMASLMAALKTAIQVKFQLEDNELAAEPLPDRDNRTAILLFEAAEGGAGVLRQIVDDPEVLSEIAREALKLCHYDPSTGKDMKRAQNAREDCEAACYDCLMSYSNQRDHEFLDRALIKDILLELASSKVEASSTTLSRSDQLARLMRLAGSSLEHEWLTYIEENTLKLPTDSQKLIERCGTRPDFIYSDDRVVVYIDGPPHDFPDRAERDVTQTECLEDIGFTVIRFGHNENWDEKIAHYPHVFGRPS